MRYPADQKPETHQRIINTAAQAFRDRGFDGLGVAEMMQEAGLTQGGFYRHFSSKEALYTEAVTRGLQQVGDQLVNIAQSAGAGLALRHIIEYYLSPGHMKSVESGCVIAALAPEIRRRPAAVRSKIESAIQLLMNRVAPFLPARTEAEKRRKAYLLIAGMAGVLMTARAMTDSKLQKEILHTARDFYTSSFAQPN